ncbi:MAG: response regulator [Planctomycetes bacterium]|nr:response regulator [Planctomycetota bacterium]
MRILVVEDYVPLRQSLVKGLSEAGFSVDSAGDGEMGLWYARSGSYDVVVLDLMLPKIDGLTVLRKLRDGEYHNPVLILTARDGVSDRVTGLDTGADDYLVKPFAFEELLARIRVLVRRKYQQKGTVLVVGDLKIDTAAKHAQLDGRRIELTAREYALLELLALRAGSVVTRTEIWESLYEFHDDATSNVVDVYIGYLRKKLDRPGRASPIQTRRGLGYMLEDLR